MNHAVNVTAAGPAREAARKVFGGDISYASLPFETVDWALFPGAAGQATGQAVSFGSSTIAVLCWSRKPPDWCCHSLA